MSDKLDASKDGFNHGYIIAQHAPELYEMLANDFHLIDDYFTAFKAGGREYHLEQNHPKISSKEVFKGDKEIERER